MRIIDKEVMAGFRAAGCCERCNRPCPAGRDPHHAFVTRGACRIDDPMNLSSLCRECHQSAHADRAVWNEVERIVARREGYTRRTIRGWLYRVAAAGKEGPCPARPRARQLRPQDPDARRDAKF